MSNRWGGRGNSYIGTRAVQPPNWNFEERDPTTADTANYSIGDLWINQNSKAVFVLVSLDGTSTSKGELADWRQWASGDGGILTLTGNSGGAVSGDVNRNVNVVGDATTFNITGNPGTNTLTGTVADIFASTYTTDDANFAVPSSYNLNVFGAGGVTTTSAGDTVTINTDGTIATQYTTDDANTAVPAAGNLNILGAGGIATSSAGSTVTIDGSGISAGAASILSTGRIDIFISNTGGATWTTPGSDTKSAPQTNNQCPIPMDGTIDRLYVNVTASTTTTNSSVTLNVNGVNSALTTTITASTGGLFTDLVNTVAVTAGDTINFELADVAAGTSAGIISCRFTPA